MLIWLESSYVSSSLYLPGPEASNFWNAFFWSLLLTLSCPNYYSWEAICFLQKIQWNPLLLYWSHICEAFKCGWRRSFYNLLTTFQYFSGSGIWTVTFTSVGTTFFPHASTPCLASMFYTCNFLKPWLCWLSCHSLLGEKTRVKVGCSKRNSFSLLG